MEIKIQLETDSYNITLERNSLDRAGTIFDLSRKVMIITDSGVPYEYAHRLALQCLEPQIVQVPEGENTKSISQYTYLSKMLLDYGFTRTDCIVALGGGVVGDLAGFTASTYMRGIDFYNIPTTLLSQIDSSIGGKVAIDFCGIKNIIGSFYQPKGVIIDPTLLETLPERQLACGAAESIKMSLTSDPDLFDIFENDDYKSRIDEVIYRSIMIKKEVVEKDEKEQSLRRVLNFGHTVGHAIEVTGSGNLLHGECIAVGMLPMCSDGVRERLTAVLKKVGLPTDTDIPYKSIESFISKDKKADGKLINCISVNNIGEFVMERIPIKEFVEIIEGKYPYKAK